MLWIPSLYVLHDGSLTKAAVDWVLAQSTVIHNSIIYHYSSIISLYSWYAVLAVDSTWAAERQNQRYDLCAKQRLRSAWASAQSDQSLLCAQWVAKDLMFLHGDREDSDQTGWKPRLIWIFAGRTVIWLVLSCGGSYVATMLLLPSLMSFQTSYWYTTIYFNSYINYLFRKWFRLSC